MEHTILLLDEEHRGSHWGLGWANPTGFQVLLKKGIQFLLFQSCQWVYLAAFWRCISYELNCMVPGFRLREVVEGFFREDGVEVTQVWGGVLLMVHVLRVLFESLCKSLGDCGRCLNVLQFREESGCPDLITFFKWFIGRIFGSGVRLVFILCILYESWKWAGATGIDLLGVFLLDLPPIF